MKSISTVLAVLLLVSGAVAHAAMWHVAPPPAGSDSNDCSAAAPCATVARGISMMSDGDELVLADGTYGTGAITAIGGCAGGTTHINLRPIHACPDQGCVVRAANVTDPPSVTLTNARNGIVNDRANNWTFDGLSMLTEVGIRHCEANDVAYRNLRFEFSDPVTTHLFDNSRNVMLDHVVTFRRGRPCDLPTQAAHGIGLLNVNDMTIQDSYLGYVKALFNLENVNGLTLKRSQLRHWAEHGIVMKRGTRNVLLENNIMGGVDRCSNPDEVRAPRLVDMYEGQNVTVRNNTIVGHGYAPRNMTVTYSAFGNAYAGCALSPAEPGFCEVDQQVSCTVNDLPKIPGVAYSEASSQCPTRNDGKPWSPNQRCSGVCDHRNVKFYNNIVYDLQDTGEPMAGTSYVNWLATGRWATTTRLGFDGNYYSGGVVDWFCAGGGGHKDSMAGWRDSLCEGGPHPDPHGIVGRCSSSPISCGVDSECPGAEVCVPTPPSFVSYGGGNYRPNGENAVQVDAGVGGIDADGVARCAGEDFDGTPRSDGACDIGAFELAEGGGSGSSTLNEPPGQVQNPRRTDRRD